MNHCYGKFIPFAPHPIEAVRVPFGDKAMPGRQTGKMPSR
jgi:hypothetical protein